MGRLSVRLSLLTALVALLASVLTAAGTHGFVGSRFESLIKAQVQRSSGQAAQVLGAFYAERGSWEGVQSLVAPGGGPRGVRFLLGRQFTLLDDTGRVVAASESALVGTYTAPDFTERAAPVFALGRQVGTLYVDDPRRPFTGVEGDFARAALLAAVGTAIAALFLAALVGVVTARRLTRPLDALVQATRRLAAGDRSQRVEVGGAGEIGDLARAFNDMSASLEEQERLRKNLLADVAHELRTPVSVLLANFEAMQDGAVRLTPESLLPMHDEVLRMARLISDLQVLSLAEAGQLPLHRVPTAPARLVEGVLSALEPEAAAHGVAIQADVPASLPRVDVDPDRITQVLANLLVNALRHTPDGGRVTVRATAAGDRVQIAVADTGEGIPAADLPHIFDRFYRAEHSRSRDSGGIGLGLSIVRGLVHAHGGLIWVQSHPGHGAVFTFTLPVVP